MNPLPRPFTLILPSDLKLLPLARIFVEGVCQFCRCDPAFAESIQLALHEALQNAIRHAHQGRGDAMLEIQAQPHDDGLELRLLDDGDPFDVSGVPHLDPGELRIGGRGVFLIRRLVDEVHSEPREPRGNVLRMVKYYSPVPKRHPA
jgi:serine/threonine-protein kinase RsbW